MEESDLTTFQIEIRFVETKVYKLQAETWQEAVELASEESEEEGLQTIGGFGVYNADGTPLNTWA